MYELELQFGENSCDANFCVLIILLASTLYHRHCCSKLLFMSSCANSIAVDRLPEAHLQLQIMTVDFNQRCLKTPKFVQCIQSSTRGINTLDCVYSNLKHTYKAIRVCHPSFTAYAPLRRSEPGQKGLCHSCRMDSLTHKGFFLWCSPLCFTLIPFVSTFVSILPYSPTQITFWKPRQSPKTVSSHPYLQQLYISCWDCANTFHFAQRQVQHPQPILVTPNLHQGHLNFPYFPLALWLNQTFAQIAHS